jgi:dGTPase
LVLARHPGIAPARLAAELIRDQIGDMVADVLAETWRRVAAAGAESVEDVRAAGGPLAGFSAAIADEERALKDFLYARMYRAPPILVIQAEARRTVARLFAAYRESPDLLPLSWRAGGADPVKRDRRIGDFIAGMTDRYAIARYREIFGEPDLPDIF